MKKFRKTVLVIMTALMMLLALTPYGSVLAEDGEPTPPYLIVGGVMVTEENKDDILGDGGKARFDPTTGTLTFSDPVFADGIDCPILSDGIDITIEGRVKAVGTKFGILVDNGTLTIKSGDVYAKGNSPIECTNLVVGGGTITVVNVPSGSDGKPAVIAEDSIKISGGELNITATGDKCRGLYAGGALTVTDGTVTVNADGRDSCYGICSVGVLTVQGGNINVTVNAVKLDFYLYYSYGLYSDSAIRVSGGTVNVNSTSTYNARGFQGVTEISGGEVTISARGEYSHGIDTDSFNISGGKCSVTAENDSYGYGMYVSSDPITGTTGTFTVTGGELTAKSTGGKTVNDTCDGIHVTGDILISGGKVTAIGEGPNPGGIVQYDFDSTYTIVISGGEVMATASGSYANGLWTNQHKLIISGGKVTADVSGSDSTAIVSYEGMEMSGGEVTATASGTNTDGILTGGDIVIGNGIVKVTASGSEHAIGIGSETSPYKITLGEELTIIDPSGGKLSDDSKTINNASGNTATHTVIVNNYPYVINVSDTENGTVCSSRTKANGGEKVTLTVSPAENCKLASISVDTNGNDIPLTENSGNYEFTMPASDVTVTAEFIRYYTVNIPEDSQSFISVDPAEAPAGERVSVVLKDVEDYVIKGVTVTDSEGRDIEVGEDNTFEMPASAVTVTAETGRLFTITFELNGGTLNGETGTVTVKLEEGTIITLEKPVKEGYTFKYWEGSEYYAGDEYEVTEEHTLAAVWEKNRVPDTGDSDMIIMYIYLMAAALAGAAAVIVYRRRTDSI